MVGLLLLPLFLHTVPPPPVRASEERILLPTYATKPPDKVPLFYRPEEVQLAERHIYPYPFYDVQDVAKEERDYLAVVLENEYLKLCITPEMGGRLYYALDKTNDYQIVYYNRVVKPALIGTIGAWTSGGIEWNTPHHHRATSLIDVDYTVTEGSDGSKTVWVGEYEKRSQTRWLTGLTLEPGKAYARITFKSMNVTPFQYPALYFANVAVHVNDDYQFIFPPDVEMVNFHYVTEFARWPIPNQVYQSVDYTNGEDVSWWKTLREPTSFFVTKTSQDFMGGIDHGKEAGIVLIGDHRIFKGKKLWNWGKNEVQQVWDQKLTDEDGPYAELMMGFYSDNQPDYNFVAPFETKYGDMYMFGIKGLSGIKEANKEGAINLEWDEDNVLIQINVTSAYPEAKVILLGKGRTVFQQSVDLSPQRFYQATLPLPPDMAPEDLCLSVFSREGVELLSWQPKPRLNEPFPETYQDPPDPNEYTHSQDAYYAGLKLEQFGNTNFDYMKYYEAALRLHPDDVPTNARLGQIYLKRYEYALSEKHLRKAAAIVTGNHKKAEEADSLYYLGVCLARQDRIEEALEWLYRATWAYEWTSAGYTLAAQLEAAAGRMNRALENAVRACLANSQNVEALVIRAVASRVLGALADAQQAAEDALDIDPLCFPAMNELRILDAQREYPTKRPGEWQAHLYKHLREEPYNYIETAARYSALGRYAEAAELMQLALDSPYPSLRRNPMAYYHLALYLDRMGQHEASKSMLHQASQLSTELCFPYGAESVRTLQWAVAQNESDANALYLLGNALADYQQEVAVAHWKAAARLKPNQSILYRNMAYLQANHLQQMPEALHNIMKAISLDATEPRYFSEAHLYMAYASLTPSQLEEFLEDYGALAKDVTDIQLMRIKLDLFNGDYDKAIDLLRHMRYHIREGATFNPHVYWFDAHLQRGIQLMQRNEHDAALEYFERAMEFPANLEAERNSKIGIAYYYMGLNSKAAGDQDSANAFFKLMTDYAPAQGWGAGDFPEIAYFKARALSELGAPESETAPLFERLIENGKKRLDTVKDGRHITVSVDGSHSARLFLLERELGRKDLRVSSCYIQGLGHLGLGNLEEARSFFKQALEADPLALDPKLTLESISGPASESHAAESLH